MGLGSHVLGAAAVAACVLRLQPPPPPPIGPSARQMQPLRTQLEHSHSCCTLVDPRLNTHTRTHTHTQTLRHDARLIVPKTPMSGCACSRPDRQVLTWLEAPPDYRGMAGGGGGENSGTGRQKQQQKQNTASFVGGLDCAPAGRLKGSGRAAEGQRKGSGKAAAVTVTVTATATDSAHSHSHSHSTGAGRRARRAGRYRPYRACSHGACSLLVLSDRISWPHRTRAFGPAGDSFGLHPGRRWQQFARCRVGRGT
ncbi:uncharacterized protein SETTUDRAFT_38814 [Exserohilum turcica Et28A]|uniref:Uncharacterized protein n=1 Tax=Exserohilum turcicum (strain 28A) TaxID=671987 RepID=R0KFS2_EXST2|nr:uncharacterized protein SETTUDRAFT_38814 [Exserohilum turcica Et28A]EOA88139.1 hypothetical protein SETTUDRAFT_38814 [Exserohilum turcica Et28A]